VKQATTMADDSTALVARPHQLRSGSAWRAPRRLIEFEPSPDASGDEVPQQHSRAASGRHAPNQLDRWLRGVNLNRAEQQRETAPKCAVGLTLNHGEHTHSYASNRALDHANEPDATLLSTLLERAQEYVGSQTAECCCQRSAARKQEQYIRDGPQCNEANICEGPADE
jgi:hypothetical protein